MDLPSVISRASAVHTTYKCPSFAYDTGILIASRNFEDFCSLLKLFLMYEMDCFQYCSPKSRLNNCNEIYISTHSALDVCCFATYLCIYKNVTYTPVAKASMFFYIYV